MNCPNCGSQINDGATFCSNCGTNFASDNQQVVNSGVIQQTPSMGEQQVVNPGVVQQAPSMGEQQAINQTASNTTNVGTLNYFKYMINAIIKPYDNYKENESKFDDFKNGIILSIILVAIMGVANIITSIISVIRVGSIYGSSTGELVGELLKSGAFYGGIVKLMLVYIAALFIAAGVYFLASLIVKKDVKFPKLLGVATTALIPGALIICILAPLGLFISFTVSEVIALVGVIYSVVILIEIINDTIVMENKNSKIYFNAICMSIILLAVLLLVSFMVKESLDLDLDSYGLSMIRLFK